MGVINNLIAIQGIEANTAGIMTSVKKLAGDIYLMKTGEEILKAATVLSGQTDITLKDDLSIFDYHNIGVEGYLTSNSGGKRFSFNIDTTNIIGVGDVNVAYLGFIGADPVIIMAQITSEGVLKLTARNTDNQLISGVNIRSIVGYS